MGAIRTVFADFLGTSAAALYTFVGKQGSHCRVRRFRATNTDAATTISVAVVPAGETLSDPAWAEVWELPLAAAGEDKHVLEYEPDASDGGLELKNGDRFVAWAADATVAGRLDIEDDV